MFCTKCGANLSEDAIFCNKCGQKTYIYGSNTYLEQPQGNFCTAKKTGLNTFFQSDKLKGLFIAFMILSGVMLLVLLIVPYGVLEYKGNSYPIWLVRKNNYPSKLNSNDTGFLTIFMLYLFCLCGMVTTMIVKKFKVCLIISCLNFICLGISCRTWVNMFDKIKNDYYRVTLYPIGVLICFGLISATAIIASIIWWDTKKLNAKSLIPSQSTLGNGFTTEPYAQRSSVNAKGYYQSRRDFILKEYDWRIVRLRRILTILSVVIMIICIWSIIKAITNYISTTRVITSLSSYFDDAEAALLYEKTELIMYFIFSVATMILTFLGLHYKHYGFYIAIIFTKPIPIVENSFKVIAFIIVFGVAITALVISLKLNKKYTEAQLSAKRQIQS